MFDAKLRPLIDPPLNRLGRLMARRGLTANQVTLAGAALGAAAGFAIGAHHPGIGLGLVLCSRVLDGLDGAIARIKGPTDLGGYLDILGDYIFYLAVPLGFAYAAPQNLPYALALVASFTLTAVSFLGYAILAAKRGVTWTPHGRKSFVYSTGLAEGAETIAAFAAMCVFPDRFAAIATILIVLCLLTVVQRTVLAHRDFGRHAPPDG